MLVIGRPHAAKTIPPDDPSPRHAAIPTGKAGPPRHRRAQRQRLKSSQPTALAPWPRRWLEVGRHTVQVSRRSQHRTPTQPYQCPLPASASARLGEAKQPADGRQVARPRHHIHIRRAYTGSGAKHILSSSFVPLGDFPPFGFRLGVPLAARKRVNPNHRSLYATRRACPNGPTSYHRAQASPKDARSRAFSVASHTPDSVHPSNAPLQPRRPHDQAGPPSLQARLLGSEWTTLGIIGNCPCGIERFTSNLVSCRPRAAE